ncbi:MAG TPA: hypothetical protein VE685_15305 [Thermoanaerobaculia bacterium]|nr:hypothetical protein [Thermoanaerobaculia bacterium]
MKVAVLVLVFSMAAASGCNGSGSARTSPAEVRAGAVAFETIIQRSLPGQAGGTIREAARDQAAWEALWARLRQGDGTLPEQTPTVDFQSEMVIVAAMETQSCVSKVTIRGIAQGRGELVVDLLEAPPAPNCVCITSERPIHVVRLRRSPDPVRFDAERGQTPC